MTNQVTQTDIQYRRMSAHDIDAAHKLSISVRWPHRPDDWRLVHRLGTGFVAEHEGSIVGTALCWSHGAQFASIGMVIVSRDWQGKGLGRKLMGMAMSELGKRNVLLHATEAGVGMYQRLGFEACGAVHQHQGTVFQPPLVGLPPGERIRPLGARDAPKLAALGARASGMPRGTVLSALLEVAETVVIDRYDEVIGCAMLRRFGHGYAIGPVIAPDIERAKALITHWAGTYADSFVRIDVAANSGLGDWLNGLGLIQVDAVVAMVRGEQPLPDADTRQFAIINQALG